MGGGLPLAGWVPQAKEGDRASPGPEAEFWTPDAKGRPLTPIPFCCPEISVPNPREGRWKEISSLLFSGEGWGRGMSVKMRTLYLPSLAC